MTNPTVSVVLAVYNGRPYLEEAVQSIRDQTFKDFEFIIVNDGSTDGSKKVLERFAGRDERVHLVHQENKGLIASLNRGLDMARGQYIARMDADDISHPERFARQVQFLENNPEIGILGSQVELIDESANADGEWSFPTDPDQVAWRLLFGTCLCHPSVMMRASLVQDLGGYATWATHGEDYELWTRALTKSRLANLPEALLKYRRHNDTVSEQNNRVQHQTVCRAASKLHRSLLGPAADRRFSRFLAWMNVGWMRPDGVSIATNRTDVEDLASVIEYIRALYSVYADRLAEGRNMEARKQAIVMQDMIASKLRGVGKELLYKVTNRLMPPSEEVVLSAANKIKS